MKVVFQPSHEVQKKMVGEHGGGHRFHGSYLKKQMGNKETKGRGNTE